MKNDFVIYKLAFKLLADSSKDDERKYEYRISKNGKPDGNGWEKTPNSKNSNSYRRKREEYKERASKPQKPSRPHKPSKPQKPWILGMKDSLDDCILIASDYEYTVTDGGKPEGEGWEKTPHPRVQNSWRRKKKPSHDEAPKLEVKNNHFDANKLPADLTDGMEILFGDHPGDYYAKIYNSPEIKNSVQSTIGDYTVNGSTKSRLKNFSEGGSGRTANARRNLSAVMANVMDVNPDGYSITPDDMPKVSSEDVKDARKFVKASQEAMKMMGFVNDDGTVTLYRGTNDQFDDDTKKYKGTNCESWTIDPEMVFHENQILKADIPLERVIGCFAGTGHYRFDEREVTCCTNDLDFKCERIKPDESGSYGNPLRKEKAETNKRIQDNLKGMLKQLLDYQKTGMSMKDMGKMLQELGPRKGFSKIASSLEATPEILSSMKENPEWLTRLKVAGHPNTNAETLESMTYDRNSFVRELASQKYQEKTGKKFQNETHEDKHEEAEPPQPVKKEVSQEEHETNLKLASDSQTSQDVLDQLSNEDDIDIKLRVSLNSSASGKTLEKLSKDTSNQIRTGVALNPNAPSDVLKDLSSDPSVIVRKSVASNLSCPQDVLDSLLDDPVGLVKMQAIKNPAISEESLKRLANDNTAYLSKLAGDFLKKHQLPIETLKIMADDGDEFAKGLLKIKSK